jgi:hypothetical protein
VGVTGPEPVPHPDHVIIDLDKGTAYIRGPRTKEEKQQLDVWRQYKKLFEEEIEELRALLADPEYPDQAGLLEEIAKTEYVLEIMRVVLAAGRIPAEFPILEPCEPSSDGNPEPT